jgi:DNA-binding NarL/FixJ family response regulator
MNDTEIDRVLQSIDPIGCVLNGEGIILEVSSGWKKAADRNGLQLQNYAVGANYLKHCLGADAASLDTYRGLTKVLTGRAPFFGTVYPCHHPDRQTKWFFLTAFGATSAADRTLVLHLDVSDVMNISRLDDRALTDSSDAILGAVRRVVREELANFSSAPTPVPAADPEGERRLARLTSRQLQLLRFLAKGYSNAQIATQLGIALSSVKSQTATLLRALSCANRTQAALFGARLGLDRSDA